MNTIRMMAVALPMTILLACGGGGGGGATVAAPTPMNTPDPMTPPTMNVPDPNTPPTTVTPPPDNTPEDLPAWVITNSATARGYFTGSTAPSVMTSDAIEGVFRSRASATGVEVLFGDIVEIGGSTRSTSCTGTTCTGTLSDNTALEYSFSEFGNTPEINSQALLGFNDKYALVMMDEGVILAQGRAAGRLGSTSYEFLNYGGWLTNSAFGVQHETADGSGNNDIRYISAYSFGVPSGSNPNVTGVVNWHGVTVGAFGRTGDLVQGRAIMQIAADNPTVATLRLTPLRNLNTGASIDVIVWESLPIENGGLSATDGSLQGTFYGTGHTEVGGTFNRNGIIGAFGGVRQ